MLRAERKWELNPAVAVGRAVCRWRRSFWDEVTAGDRWNEPQEIKAGNITAHLAACHAWAFSIFARRQKSDSIRTQTLKCGGLNRETSIIPRPLEFVYFLFLLQPGLGHNTWKTSQQTERERCPRTRFFLVCHLAAVALISSTYVYKQGSADSGAVRGARLCVIFAAGGEISLRLIWEQSAEAGEQCRASKPQIGIQANWTSGHRWLCTVQSPI